MRVRAFSLLFAILVSATAFATVRHTHGPLSKELHFDAAATKSAEPITVVITPEFTAVTGEHKVMWERIVFNIGESVGANLVRALEANYTTVKTAASPAEVTTAKWIEPKFYSFEGKLPRTSFGTYETALKVGFVLHDGKTEHEYVEDVVGTDKRDASQVLFDVQFRWTGANKNETRLALAANGAVQKALDQLVAELKSASR